MLRVGAGCPAPAIPAATKPNYGIDSPWIIKALSCFGLFALIAGFLIDVPDDLFLLQAPLVSFRLAGIMAIVQAALLAASSLIGKLKERDRLISAILWRGDEQVLDVGCGRGLLLIAAAKRLRTGRAVGVDTWRSQDLTDNWAEATMDNARIEGVDLAQPVSDGDFKQMLRALGACDPGMARSFRYCSADISGASSGAYRRDSCHVPPTLRRLRPCCASSCARRSPPPA